MLTMGLDIGSTTLKFVVLNEQGEIVYSNYQRHFSKITESAAEMLRAFSRQFGANESIRLCISGSAGMGLAEQLGIPFVQEVYATRLAVRRLSPDTDAVIELGGEDAKILFLSGGIEVRMNGSCAGGTGAFIDQMATLLGVGANEMNELAKQHTKIYSIASRCGVFAKSDIQPLLNQGAKKEDICASIFAAVVNQTVAGLAQGREIAGNVMYLGGPLTFMSELRALFDKELGLTGKCPENSLYYVAYGAALGATDECYDIDNLIGVIENYAAAGGYVSTRPLFADRADYEEFCRRHPKTQAVTATLGDDMTAYIGIDAGSTTVKMAALNSDGEVIFARYQPNSGNPVPIVKDFIGQFYAEFPDAVIAGAASTGYGEEIIKHAFHVDFGIVETMAHFLAAKKFDPQVDFIIDIGGQDIKCFKIRGGAVDNIFLNEACSSGCGSFLQTFAGALGYTVEQFAEKGLFADRPVDLGSRCTVFMNSSVKQAQKDGATIENISAGLSMSVVKNALYKVIRIGGGNQLGDHIVVQGGTFLNDAVLRAFELETGKQVTRPAMSGLMGAIGAALYARKNSTGKSELLGPDRLLTFVHKVEAITCKGCTNHCRLTVNTFDDGGKFIGGNQCDRPIKSAKPKQVYNMYDYKRELLASYEPCESKNGLTVGLPLGLNMLELLPFWHTFFKSLGFGIMMSPPSSKKLYHAGQSSIPSDTVCYPAKLIHGHIRALADSGVDFIFYPCMTYNFDEQLGDNHFNCPVVAYYPEVISGNKKAIGETLFINSYVGIHRPKDFVKKILTQLNERLFVNLTLKQVRTAADAAYAEYNAHMARIRHKGEEYLAVARKEDLPIIVLCGRPYHIDTEINHGIDKYICALGAVLLSEDSLGAEYHRNPTTVLNQWTYHSRLYAAANFVADHRDENIDLVQLVSFGCGLDAITTDEVRAILESSEKIYTQIKIDEITNLGAVKIRLRSLFAASAMLRNSRKGGGET